MPRRRPAYDEDLLDDEPAPPVRKRRRPRWRWRLLAALLLIVALVITAPMIIARSPLRNVLLSAALPPGAGRVTAAAASFSWTTGQSLAGVAHVAADGASL